LLPQGSNKIITHVAIGLHMLT